MSGNYTWVWVNQDGWAAQLESHTHTKNINATNYSLSWLKSFENHFRKLNLNFCIFESDLKKSFLKIKSKIQALREGNKPQETYQQRTN